MGNEQSAPTPRRPNKLSKPRTNNNSSADLLSRKVSASAPVSRRNSITTNASPTKNRQCVLEPEDTPKQEKPKKRLSLFRSRSSQYKKDQALVVKEVEPSPIEHRWSRDPRPGNSATRESSRDSYYNPVVELRPPPRKRMSLQQYSHNPRLSLVAELPSPTPEQSEKRMSKIEDTITSTADPLVSRNSDTQLYAPIRRRSLLQHGVATRTSWAENDSRTSLPSQVLADDLRDYYYDRSRPTNSPLSNLVALAPNPEFDIPGPRTETPTGREYGHIGAFKLGSLRITNGAASPVPSFEGRAATMGAEDDYLTIGERRSTESARLRSHRSNTLSVPSEARKAPWIVRSESPLRQTHETERGDLTVETQLTMSDSSFALFDFQAHAQLFKTTESPTKALELANEYQQDLELSPFSFDNSPPPSPGFQVTSKHMAVEDELFEAEPTTPDISERLHRSFDSGYEAPTRAVKGPRDFAPKPLAKADSGYSSNVSLRSFKKDGPAVPGKDAPPTPPKESTSRVPSSTYTDATVRETDSRVSSSTYSEATVRGSVSRVSSSTYSQATPRETVSRVSSSIYSERRISNTYSESSGRDQLYAENSPDQGTRIPSSTYSVASNSSEMTIRVKRSLPALPQDDFPSQPFREAPPVSLKSKSHTSVEALRQPNLEGSKMRRKSMPAVPRTSTREDSPATSDVSSNSSKRITKMERRTLSVQPAEPYTVQAFRTPSEVLAIPPPSAEARRRLDERVDGFPVACFPNTMAGDIGLRRSSSKETLGTIFSVGSTEVREELSFARLQSALPAIPKQETIPEHPKILQPGYDRRNTYQGPERGRNSFQQPMIQSRPNSKSRAQINEEFETHLTSFDNVSSSLGKSPYELAANTIPRKIIRDDRAKSMTASFEADAATQFYQARTRNEGPIQPRKSYEHIQAKNSPTRSSFSEMKRHSRPPATHANRRSWANIPSIPPVPQYDEEDDRRLSNISAKGLKAKSPPPVSMQTQRKMAPTPLGAHTIIPPSRTPPLPAKAPERTPPLPPAHSAQSDTEPQAWSQTSNAWAARRKSAGEALQARKSMELQRPSISQLPSKKSVDPSHARVENNNLNGRKSFDNSWNRGVGYDDAHGGYDHTFGIKSLPSYNPLSSSYEEEAEYYPPPSRSPVHPSSEEQFHSSQNSTSDMLVLDRFAGGLDYGYERGVGLVGSAGTRSKGMLGGDAIRSKGTVEEYGVDLSDVPVFLQRVGVRG